MAGAVRRAAREQARHCTTHRSGDVGVTPSAGGREIARFLTRTGGRLRGASLTTICLTEIGPFATEARADPRLSD